MKKYYLKDDFLFFREENITDDNFLGDRFVVNSNDIQSCVDYINNHNLKNILITPEYYKLNNLDFLKSVSNIEGLYVLSDLVDLELVNRLHQIQILRIGKTKAAIDLKNFPQLKVLSFTFSQKVKNLASATTLNWLWIDNYKADDLIELRGLQDLLFLTLVNSSIKNLNGIEYIRKLKYLRLDVVKNLESLQGLNNEMKFLEVVDIWAAPKLRNYDALSFLPSVKQLELRRTGDCESISFISTMPKLEKVTIGFKVTDGNMEYLTRVPNKGFIDFAHYSHKMKDFK